MAASLSSLLPTRPPFSITSPSFSRPSRARRTPKISAALKPLKPLLSATNKTLYGMFLLSADPTLAEIAGLAGYDYVVVDMEHGPGGISSALSCLRALASTSTPAILRLPESSPSWAKKALDIGPQGIMFPMINDAESASEAVSYCRYPPRGIRGAAFPVVRASGYGINERYLGDCEEELVIMCQVETEKAAAEVERIAAVDGVDCVQMGPLDLSADLGFLFDPGNEEVRKMLGEIERKILAKGDAYLSGFAMNYDPPEALKRRGYRMVAGAVDLGMFRKAAVEDVRRFKESE